MKRTKEREKGYIHVATWAPSSSSYCESMRTDELKDEYEVPIVAFAVVLFDVQRHSEGVEVAVGRIGQRSVPDVCGFRGTTKGCRKTIQDTADLCKKTTRAINYKKQKAKNDPKED